MIVSTRTVVLTAGALIAFAANSILCRAALATDRIDAASFTSVRLLSGAAALAVFARLATGPRGRGSWTSAAALFAYAIAFSFAYLRIPAGVGALVLFGFVQATMIGADLFSGSRPHRGEWLGLLASLAGLGWLAWPGFAAPDLVGTALMALAGIAWGVYSLRGKANARPLGVTADNFARSVPFALAASLLSGEYPRATAPGIALAVASGALTSGLGYVVWYAALPRLTPTRAAIVQLTVPVLAAIGGVAFLDETVSVRLLTATPLVLGGVAIAVASTARNS